MRGFVFVTSVNRANPHARATLARMHPTPHTCGSCRHTEPSKREGYGYCRAGRTPEERALFLPSSRECTFQPSRYQETTHASAPSR